ncbi:MAG: hypothetical protein ABJA93_13905 [Sporichthyaceae bacterium]
MTRPTFHGPDDTSQPEGAIPPRHDQLPGAGLVVVVPDAVGGGSVFGVSTSKLTVDVCTGGA